MNTFIKIFLALLIRLDLTFFAFHLWTYGLQMKWNMLLWTIAAAGIYIFHFRRCRIARNNALLELDTHNRRYFVTENPGGLEEQTHARVSEEEVANIISNMSNGHRHRVKKKRVIYFVHFF